MNVSANTLVDEFGRFRGQIKLVRDSPPLGTNEEDHRRVTVKFKVFSDPHKRRTNRNLYYEGVIGPVSIPQETSVHNLKLYIPRNVLKRRLITGLYVLEMIVEVGNRREIVDYFFTCWRRKFRLRKSKHFVAQTTVRLMASTDGFC